MNRQSEVPNATDKMSVASDPSREFRIIVKKLKVLKIRGEEAVKHSVQLIRDYQIKFGNSEKQLKTLATAVGVTTRTFYRWIKQVENPTPKPKVKEDDLAAEECRRLEELFPNHVVSIKRVRFYYKNDNGEDKSSQHYELRFRACPKKTIETVAKAVRQ